MFNVYVFSAFILLVLFTAWLLFVRYPERYNKQVEAPERRYEHNVQLVEKHVLLQQTKRSV